MCWRGIPSLCGDNAGKQQGTAVLHSHVNNNMHAQANIARVVLPRVSLCRLQCIWGDVAMGNDSRWPTTSGCSSLNDSVSSRRRAMIRYEPDQDVAFCLLPRRHIQIDDAVKSPVNTSESFVCSLQPCDPACTHKLVPVFTAPAEQI